MSDRRRNKHINIPNTVFAPDSGLVASSENTSTPLAICCMVASLSQRAHLPTGLSSYAESTLASSSTLLLFLASFTTATVGWQPEEAESFWTYLQICIVCKNKMFTMIYKRNFSFCCIPTKYGLFKHLKSFEFKCLLLLFIQFPNCHSLPSVVAHK